MAATYRLRKKLPLALLNGEAYGSGAIRQKPISERCFFPQSVGSSQYKTTSLSGILAIRLS